MKARQLWFTGSKNVEIRESTLTEPGDGDLLVQTLYSSISAGTEMLVYRGQLPGELALDTALTSLTRQSRNYPVQYGYATVGRVIASGVGTDPDWQDSLVFGYQPHASYYIESADNLIIIPPGMTPLAAVFLANTETAVNLVLDGQPLLGERVLVIGQGVVGLLTTATLNGFPLATLDVIERIASRRSMSESLGASRVMDIPNHPDQFRQDLGMIREFDGYDLVYEMTGAPEALDLAINSCGYAGRVIVGSWYGTKCAPVHLGGRFHRNRIQIISSQVSTISPALRGRWDRGRRFKVAWDMIRRINPEQFITHQLPFEQAGDIYRLIDQTPEQVLQAVMVYPDH